MSLILVDELKEHTSGAGILISSPVTLNGNLRVNADSVAHVGTGVSASTDIFGGADNPATPKCAYRLFASRGTGQSPTPLQAGDWAGVIYFLGYAQTGGFGGGPVMAHITVATIDSSVVAPSAFMRIGVNPKAGSFSRDVVTISGNGVFVSPVAYSGVASEVYGMQIQVETEATSFTIGAAYGLLVDDAVKGAGSTITTQYGIKVLDQTKGATNYAIHTGIGLVAFGGAATNGFVNIGGDFATGLLSSVGQRAVDIAFMLNSTATGEGTGIRAQIQTVDSAFTVPNLQAIYILSTLKGAASTITTLYGLRIEDQTVGVTNYAIYTNAGIVRVGDLLLTVASVAGGAKFRLPHGAAPSSPVDGDVWTTTAGIFVRINGTTVGPLT